MNPTVEPLLHSAGGDIVGCGLRFARYRRRRHCWAEPDAHRACIWLRIRFLVVLAACSWPPPPLVPDQITG